jgi:hypothetical protein
MTISANVVIEIVDKCEVIFDKAYNVI